MTPAQLLELAAKLGVKAARDWLADEGITVTDELVAKGAGLLADFFEREGVTNAKRLEVDDQR